MKKRKITNPVAKFAGTFNKAKVEDSKKLYKRNFKFQKDKQEDYQIIFI